MPHAQGHIRVVMVAMEGSPAQLAPIIANAVMAGVASNPVRVGPGTISSDFPPFPQGDPRPVASRRLQRTLDPPIPFNVLGLGPPV